MQQAVRSNSPKSQKTPGQGAAADGRLQEGRGGKGVCVSWWGWGFGNKMYTGRSFDMQGFCGEMEESIPFMDEDIGLQSPIYASQLTAFKPHRTAGRYAYDLHETISLEEELNNSPTYKCPSCYGLKRQPAACKQCGDSQLVGEMHPLAALLEQVLRKSLPCLPVKEEVSRKGWDWGSSHSIQEENLPGEAAPNCKCCYSECQEFSYRVCDVCEDYAVCNDCWSKGKGVHLNHPLQIVLSHAQKVEQLARNNPLNMKKISEEFESEDASNYQDELEMTCGACSQPIEDCYQTCISCEKEGENTTICGECSELSGCPKKYGHELEMRTVKLSSKLTRLQSQQSQQSNQASPLVKSSKFKGMSKVSLINMDNEDLDNSMDNLAIGKIFVNGQEMVQMEEEVFGDSYSPTTSYRISQNTSPEHNPRNPEESMVHIEMDCSIELHETKAKLKAEDPKTPVTASPKHVNPFTFSSAGTLLHEIPTEEEYVFNDYECDICLVQPIRGKRYHCTTCENYDLCAVCYQTRVNKHEHSDFEEIDGGKILQKQREEMLKRIELRGSIRSIGSLRSMCELRQSAVK